MKKKILYLDCFAGISGDMLVGSLLDLGWSEAELRGGLDLLGIGDEFFVEVSRQDRGSVMATKFDVHLEGGHGHQGGHGHFCEEEKGHGGHGHGRDFLAIVGLIAKTGLPERVKERVVSVFRRIAEAEGKIHGVRAEEVHFHEVGAVDSIVDIVGACLGLEALGVDEIVGSRMVEGSGTVRCQHGVFPLPAPATLEILRGVSLRQVAEEGERITPTGAALVAEWASSFGEMPPMRVEKIGMGAGSRNPVGRPNVLRVVYGESEEDEDAPNKVVEIRTNLDDCTPEEVAEVCRKLFEERALDVSVAPVTMKKGRQGFLLIAVVCEGDARKMAEVLLRESSAFGVRWHPCERMVLERESVVVGTVYGDVSVKVGKLRGKEVKRVPEFEACSRVARLAGVPFREVYIAALAQSGGSGG